MAEHNSVIRKSESALGAHLLSRATAKTQEEINRAILGISIETARFENAREAARAAMRGDSQRD